MKKLMVGAALSLAIASSCSGESSAPHSTQPEPAPACAEGYDDGGLSAYETDSLGRLGFLPDLACSAMVKLSDGTSLSLSYDPASVGAPKVAEYTEIVESTKEIIKEFPTSYDATLLNYQTNTESPVKVDVQSNVTNMDIYVHGNIIPSYPSQVFTITSADNSEKATIIGPHDNNDYKLSIATETCQSNKTVSINADAPTGEINNYIDNAPNEVESLRASAQESNCNGIGLVTDAKISKYSFAEYRRKLGAITNGLISVLSLNNIFPLGVVAIGVNEAGYAQLMSGADISTGNFISAYPSANVEDPNMQSELKPLVVR